MEADVTEALRRIEEKIDTINKQLLEELAAERARVKQLEELLEHISSDQLDLVIRGCKSSPTTPGVSELSDESVLALPVICVKSPTAIRGVKDGSIEGQDPRSVQEAARRADDERGGAG